jgi:hypothetical protein
MEGDFCLQCLDAVNHVQLQLQPLALHLVGKIVTKNGDSNKLKPKPSSQQGSNEESKEESQVLEETKEEISIQDTTPGLPLVSSSDVTAVIASSLATNMPTTDDASVISSISDWLVPLRETLWYLEGRYIGALTCASSESLSGGGGVGGSGGVKTNNSKSGKTSSSTNSPVAAVAGGNNSETASSGDSEKGGVGQSSKTPERWFESELFDNIVSLSDESPLKPFIQSLKDSSDKGILHVCYTYICMYVYMLSLFLNAHIH